MTSHIQGAKWVPYGQFDGKGMVARLFYYCTDLGHEGVTFFFVLSGFLVGGKVLERTLNGTIDVRSYALDRATRIYLPLIPALILTAVLNFVTGAHPFSPMVFVGNLVGLQSVLSFIPAYPGDTPLWTLAYEMWFYVLAGLVAVICVGIGRAKVFALIGATAIFAIFTRLFPHMLFCWCLGALGYRLIGIGKSWLFAGSTLALAGLALFKYADYNKSELGSFLSSGFAATLVMSLGLTIALPCVVQLKPRSELAAKFEDLGSKLAAFSYTLYLTHFPIMLFWQKCQPEKFATLDGRSLGWYAVECASCLLIAWIIYLPCEAQTKRVRRFLSPKRP